MDSGHIAWMIVATALVIFMTPGLAFFYGGMVRSRNVLAMLMQNFFSLGWITIVWVLLGYTIAFGPDVQGLWGDFTHMGLKDVPFDSVPEGAAIPPMLFMVFQMTFAIITPALITGSLADRMRFRAWVIFLTLWSLIVYSPVAHWVWGGGWLGERGALDFAGGTVVHINAGIAGLMGAYILGTRKGWPSEEMKPHSLPWTLLGTAILWVGWFGFNAGSALAADGSAVLALTNTQMGAAAGLVFWILAERLRGNRPTTLGAGSGAVAGLVAITPAAGFVEGLSAIAIGGIAGVLCYFAVGLKFKLGYDDSLDVVGVHLVGGLTGSILTGVFAAERFLVNGSRGDQILEQIVASASVFAYSLVMTGAILIGLRAFLPGGIRVDEESEDKGLDLVEHAEQAYS